jgi:hypothetical protein
LGATIEEARAGMPGDNLVAAPLCQITQAVIVRAGPERIWPWLMQTGQRRGGFYADSAVWDACVDLYYRVLSRERGVLRERYRHVDDRITDAWQDRAVGDLVMDGPPGTAYYVVRELIPQQVRVMFTDTHLPHLVPARWRAAVHGELKRRHGPLATAGRDDPHGPPGPLHRRADGLPAAGCPRGAHLGRGDHHPPVPPRRPLPRRRAPA